MTVITNRRQSVITEVAERLRALRHEVSSGTCNISKIDGHSVLLTVHDHSKRFYISFGDRLQRYSYDEPFQFDTIIKELLCFLDKKKKFKARSAEYRKNRRTIASLREELSLPDWIQVNGSEGQYRLEFHNLHDITEVKRLVQKVLP